MNELIERDEEGQDFFFLPPGFVHLHSHLQVRCRI
jgi:hypothetical protein